MISTPAVATIAVPTEPAAYGRWLAGRVHAYASLVRRDERADLDDEARAELAEAARVLLAALADA